MLILPKFKTNLKKSVIIDVKRIRTDLIKELFKLHSNYIVHNDIKPSNMIISDDEVYVIDWEFYQLIGTKICNIGLRPLSLGSTHPDLIWGRGAITAKIDEYSIMRIFDPDCSYNIHF